MRTPLPRGEKRTPMIDIQIVVRQPIDEVDSWGTHVFMEEAQSVDAREEAIDRAFARLRRALREAMQ